MALDPLTIATAGLLSGDSFLMAVNGYWDATPIIPVQMPGVGGFGPRKREIDNVLDRMETAELTDTRRRNMALLLLLSEA